MIAKGTVSEVAAGMCRVVSDDGAVTGWLKCRFSGVQVGNRVLFVDFPDGEGAVLEVHG
jgi:hypothetical protein